MNFRAGAHLIDLSSPIVMGILNVTPDSFSDGGKDYRAGQWAIDLALARAEKMLKDGARIIDVGGESTRPGAVPVSETQELDRVIPMVEALVTQLGAVVSVDTSTPLVMTEAAKVGAAIINDVRSFRRDGALNAAVASGLPVCVMHMQGEPDTMQKSPLYQDVVQEVKTFLAERIALCTAAGIARDQIIIDPGYGFAKTLTHNLALLKGQAELVALGCPILVGLSRKAMLGAVLDRPVEERLAGSLALAMIAVARGGNIVRVHDVAATVDVLKICQAVDPAILNTYSYLRTE